MRGAILPLRPRLTSEGAAVVPTLPAVRQVSDWRPTARYSITNLARLTYYKGCRGVVGNIRVTRDDLAARAIGRQFEPYRVQGSDAMLWPGMPFP